MPSPNAQIRARKAAHRPAAPAPRSSGDGFQPQASFVVEFGALPSGRRATGIHHVEADRSARFDGFDVQSPAFWMLRRLPADAGGAAPIEPAIDPATASRLDDADKAPVEAAVVAPVEVAAVAPVEASVVAPDRDASACAPTGVPRHRFECIDVALAIPAGAGAQPSPLDPNAWVVLNAADAFAVRLRVGLAAHPATPARVTLAGDPPADRADASMPMNALLQLSSMPPGNARILARQTRALAPSGFAELAWGIDPLAPGRYELTAIVFADDAWAVPTRRRLARLVVVN